MDRRTITFITVSVLIIILYQELVLKRLPQPPPPELPAPTANLDATSAPPPSPADAAGATPPAPSAVEADTAPVASRDVIVETDLFAAVVSTAGGRIKSFTLKKFRATNEAGSPPLELIVPGEEADLPLGVELRGAQVWSDTRVAYTPSSDSVTVTGTDEQTLVLSATIAGQPLLKRLSFRGDSYAIGLSVETPPANALPKELVAAAADGQPASVALLWAKSVHAATKQAFEGAASLVDGKLVQTSIDKIEGQQVLTGTIGWTGFEDHYFITATAPDRANTVILKAHGSTIESKLLTTRDGDGPVTVGYTLFLGPKEVKDLEAAGHDLARAMNLGWFGPISMLLLRILNLSHRVTGNYGVDIILLTCLVKIAFWPLTQKSFRSMREMQKLQPEMQRLREKYKDDAKQMNTEIMELYKRHKVNPLGGCLPMVLQIPVFFGLYQLLANTIQLRHAPFILWIHDLSAPERVDIMGYGVPVLTLLLGVSMFLQQRMSPQAGDPAQQRIMMFMPILFTFMFIGFPAGLTLYWLTNNVLTIAQQYFVLRSAPPTATA